MMSIATRTTLRRFVTRLLVVSVVCMFERVVGMPVLFLGLSLIWLSLYTGRWHVAWLVLVTSIFAAAYLLPFVVAAAILILGSFWMRTLSKRVPSRILSLAMYIWLVIAVLAALGEVQLTLRAGIYGIVSLVLLFGVVRLGLLAQRATSTYRIQ